MPCSVRPFRWWIDCCTAQIFYIYWPAGLQAALVSHLLGHSEVRSSAYIAAPRVMIYGLMVMFLPPVLYKPDRRASVPSAVNGYACITSALPLALGHSATKGSLMSDLDVILHHLSHRDASADGYVRCSVRRWEVFSADRCHYLGFTVGASPLGCNFQSLMSLLYRWLSYGIATRSVFASWSMLLLR